MTCVKDNTKYGEVLTPKYLYVPQSGVPKAAAPALVQPGSHVQVEVAVLQTPLSEQPASSVQLPETAPTKSTATIKIFIIIMRRFFLVLVQYRKGKKGNAAAAAAPVAHCTSILPCVLV